MQNIRPPRPPARSTARSGTISARPNAAADAARGARRRAGAPPPPAAEGQAGTGAEARGRAGAVGNAVFPSAVDPKYAKESAGKARMHTCVDQYNANKASNGNGGMKWIQKGGGYYSECNKKLKGA